MNTELIVRAWKDPGFRASLSAEQRAALPDNPSGRSMAEMNEVELGDAVGQSARNAFQDLASTFPDCTLVLTGKCHCFL